VRDIVPATLARKVVEVIVILVVTFEAARRNRKLLAHRVGGR
jgi:hypothetical protein